MRSKPNLVDQPKKLLIMIAQCALLKCYTIPQHRDSSVNIPLPQDQHHEAKWRLGGSPLIEQSVRDDTNLSVCTMTAWSGLPLPAPDTEFHVLVLLYPQLHVALLSLVLSSRSDSVRPVSHNKDVEESVR